MPEAWSGRLIAGASACALLVDFGSSAHSAQTEGVYQWRYLAGSEGGYLQAADSDSTDNSGPITFTCKRGSSQVKVEVKIANGNLKPFSRIIAEDKYPKILLGETKPSQGEYIVKNILFSQMYGWTYDFDVDVGTEALQKFAKTGAFTIIIADFYKDSMTLKSGLEEVAKFRKECIANRKASAN